MKYFTQEDSEPSASASLSKARRKVLDRKFSRNWKAYQKQLKKLEGRIPRKAWNFFYFGFGGWGLHDALLIDFSAGDGLDHVANGSRPFNENGQQTQVRIRILNRKQTFLYSFVCKDIRRVIFNCPLQDPRWDCHRIELLETYELTAVNKRCLRLEFLFSSNTTLLVEFGRLKFRRQRVRRG